MRFFLGALAILLLIQTAAAGGIGGWPLLHWGMTKQQVELAYPNFEYYNHMFAPGPEKVLGLEEYSAAGCNFAVWLEFYDNGLYRIQLQSIIRKGDLSDQFCKAKDALLKAYGQQSEVSNLIPDKPIFTWKTTDTDVTFHDGAFGDGFREVGIAYTKHDWWKTPHQGKRL